MTPKKGSRKNSFFSGRSTKRGGMVNAGPIRKEKKHFGGRTSKKRTFLLRLPLECDRDGTNSRSYNRDFFIFGIKLNTRFHAKNYSNNM